MADRQGASWPAALAATGVFATLAYGGLKLMDASKGARQPLRIAGQGAGLAFFALGGYYAASLALIMALQALAPERVRR